jgi:hypothetical protein
MHLNPGEEQTSRGIRPMNTLIGASHFPGSLRKVRDSLEDDGAVFRPSHKNLKIDEADYHISTAATAN